MQGLPVEGSDRGVGQPLVYLDDGALVGVEELVLRHSARQGWRGVHCEGSMLATLFGVLLWDQVSSDSANSVVARPSHGDGGSAVRLGEHECGSRYSISVLRMQHDHQRRARSRVMMKIHRHDFIYIYLYKVQHRSFCSGCCRADTRVLAWFRFLTTRSQGRSTHGINALLSTLEAPLFSKPAAKALRISWRKSSMAIQD